MVFPSNLENLAIRFSPYIAELQQFFVNQGIQFGSPADLTPFADRVEGSVPLRDDIGSLLRSILYREAEKITPSEVFEVLVLAVAGQKINEIAPEFQAANIRLFRLVNEVLRNRRKPMPDPVDAAQAPESVDRRARPDTPVSLPAMLLHDAVPAEDVSSNATETSGKSGIAHNKLEPVYASSARLFSSYAAVEPPPETHREVEKSSGRGRLIFVCALVALILAGGAFYLGRSGLLHVPQQTGDKQPASPETQTVAAPGRSMADCRGSSQARTPTPNLAQDYAHTEALKSQKQYFPALYGLLDIATADPVYPGVYLEIADLDLQLHRPQQARDAIDAQMAISDCLAALPTPAVDAYCKSELATETAESCTSHLARIRSDAQLFQTTLAVQKSNRPPDVASTSSKPTSKPAAPPAISSVARPPAKPARTTTRPPHGDPSLVEGQGTDSALGAYSKPQN